MAQGNRGERPRATPPLNTTTTTTRARSSTARADDLVDLTPRGRVLLELHEQLAGVHALRAGAARAGVDLVDKNAPGRARSVACDITSIASQTAARGTCKPTADAGPLLELGRSVRRRRRRRELFTADELKGVAARLIRPRRS